MSVFDKKARMRRRGADDNASNILSADTNPPFHGCISALLYN
jgi:hypothetical protein